MTDLQHTAERYLEVADWKLLPLYVAIAGVCGWLGVLTIAFASSQGVEPSGIRPLADATRVLMVVLVATPLVQPAITVAVELRRGEGS